MVGALTQSLYQPDPIEDVEFSDTSGLDAAARLGTAAETPQDISGALAQMSAVPGSPLEAYRLKAQQRQQERRAIYDQQAQLLREQRVGMTKKERLLETLAAFGQPVRGGMGEALANAARVTAARTIEERKVDRERQAALAQLMAKQQLEALQAAETADTWELRAGASAAKGAGADGKPLTGTVGTFQSPDGQQWMRFVRMVDGAPVTFVQNLTKEGPPIPLPSARGAPASGPVGLGVSAPRGAEAPSARAPAVGASPTEAPEPAAGGPTYTYRGKVYREGGTFRGPDGRTYRVDAYGMPQPVSQKEEAVPTRMDPTGRGGEQVLNTDTGEYTYQPGQSPEELERAGREQARMLGVPYRPPPISANQPAAQRGAALNKYIQEGIERRAALRQDAADAGNARSLVQQFIALNSRSSGLTGPVRGKIAGILPPDDVRNMQSITQKMKVVEPRTPGAISNFEDAGLTKAVPNVESSLQSNTVLANRYLAYAQRTADLQQFADAWVQSNRGSVEGMDAAWAEYLKANPSFDTSNPDGVANAIPNPRRAPWQRWFREKYWPDTVERQPQTSAPRGSSAAPGTPPRIGDTRTGKGGVRYRYKGGDPAKATSWEAL